MFRVYGSGFKGQGSGLRVLSLNLVSISGSLLSVICVSNSNRGFSYNANWTNSSNSEQESMNVNRTAATLHDHLCGVLRRKKP